MNQGGTAVNDFIVLGYCICSNQGFFCAKKEDKMGNIILTGDRPTGKLHLGHYVGSLRRRVELQEAGNYEQMYLMIADAQALTDHARQPELVRTHVMEVVLDYLAVGLNPEKCVMFIQSMVPELTELSFYYMNLVTVARLKRNPTVKAEIKLREFEQSIPAVLEAAIAMNPDALAF